MTQSLSIALLTLTAPLAAQVQLQVQKTDQAPLGPRLVEPVIGDFDGDGDQEAMGSFGILIDNYLGRFSAAPWSFPSVRYVLGAYDFDGDWRDDSSRRQRPVGMEQQDRLHGEGRDPRKAEDLAQRFRSRALVPAASARVL